MFGEIDNTSCIIMKYSGILLFCLITQVAFWCLAGLVMGQESVTMTEPDVIASIDESAETMSDEPYKSTEDDLATEDVQNDSTETETHKVEEEPFQAGPLVDLFGPKLQMLQMVNETSAQLSEQYTTEALQGKNVIGIYFSADWCGPCRQFTPELVSFYQKMNKRRGQKDKFQIVWVSRCRDVNSHYQYFTQMPWVALPPEEATGLRGEQLSNKYKVKGIPTLVLVDDLGQTITTDARNKIPQDKAGIGFPWRNPLLQIYSIILPRPLRMMVKLQVDAIRTKIVHKIKSLWGLGKKQPLAL